MIRKLARRVRRNSSMFLVQCFFVQSFEYKRKLNFEAIDGMMFHKLISCMKSSLVDYHECICRKTKFNYICLFVCMFDGVQRHFQQYFSYIVAVSFIDGRKRRTRRKPPTCRKSLTHFVT